jgi:hypothetical protein
MAEKDVLDHETALAPFKTRVASSGSGSAAENIAYGYESFPKTLEQWINSPSHQRNLMMAGATRVGIANAKSAKTQRTYWAMVIAGGYEEKKPRGAKAKSGTAEPAPQPAVKRAAKPAAQSCHLKILSLCL